ncbi:dihydrofolate reductase family protein [Streptomyces sp. NPDC059862]|uniref:dihydrofolate reductase family protein n=1 Tax=Streptomyces sp. NPDC059862 TaxID=3346975 RepID=UPI00364BDA48
MDTARLMNRLPKYVLSNKLKQVDWANAHIIGGDIRREITQLKQRTGKDIALFAGGRAISTLTAQGLIAEYRFILNPLLQGGGDAPIQRRLFHDSPSVAGNKTLCLRCRRPVLPSLPGRLKAVSRGGSRSWRFRAQWAWK